MGKAKLALLRAMALFRIKNSDVAKLKSVRKVNIFALRARNFENFLRNFSFLLKFDKKFFLRENFWIFRRKFTFKKWSFGPKFRKNFTFLSQWGQIFSSLFNFPIGNAVVPWSHVGGQAVSGRRYSSG